MSNTIHSAFTGGIGQAQLQKTNGASASQRTQGVSTVASPASDDTAISAASSRLAAALQADDTRTDKVGSIRAAIAAGTYNVDPAAIADKLIDTILR